jgi:hypothetical protein
MIGNLIEVSSKGPVYENLFNSVRFHNYASVFITSTRFTKYIKIVSSNEKASLGKLVVFDIKNIGDLLSKCYVKVELPDLSNLRSRAVGQALSQNLIFRGPNFSWINNLGVNIFEYVELLIDGNIIARYTNDYMSIQNDYNSVQDADYFKSMIKTSSTELDRCMIYIPLYFWFNKELHNALPLFELDETVVQIRMKLRNLNQLIKSDTLIDPRNNVSQYNSINATYLTGERMPLDNSGRMLQFSGSKYFGAYEDQLLDNNVIYGHLGTENTFRGEYLTGVDNGSEKDYDILSCELICTCINIGNEEKTMIRRKEYIRPIKQIQQVNYTNISTTNRTNVRLEFNNPILNLYWFYRHPNVIDYYNNYQNISRRIISPITSMPIYPLEYLPDRDMRSNIYQHMRLPGFFNDNSEWISLLSIKYGNREREEMKDSCIYRQIMLSSVCKYDGVMKYIYRYHFGKRLDEDNEYSSGLNTDRMKDIYMEFDFYNANETANFVTIAETLNIIQIVGGKATLLFQ